MLAMIRMRRGLVRSASQPASGIVSPKNSTPIICSTRKSLRGMPMRVVPQLSVNTVMK